MQNRQKHEITRDILAVCNGGSTISHIMFHSYLSHAQAKSYITELVENGMIETDPFNSRIFLSTAKGLTYLATLDNLADMLSLEMRKAKIIA